MIKPTWQTPDGSAQLYLGDCLEIMPQIGKVDAVVTSPPYAMQREKFYGGTPEDQYPEWSVNWVTCVNLEDGGNVLINIRENIKNGEMSDYVHKTRLSIRNAGLIECDEIIWIKPDSPPVGSNNRPRRSWERVLWFSNSRRPFCNPKANGSISTRIGLPRNETGRASVDWIGGFSAGLSDGVSRCRDYVQCGVSENCGNYNHPAKYPIELPKWLINAWSRGAQTILDPFMGSGTTGVACMQLNRRFIGIEIEPKYFEIAKDRIMTAWEEREMDMFKDEPCATNEIEQGEII